MQQPVARTRSRRSQAPGPRSGPRSAGAGAQPPGTLTLPSRASALAEAHPVPVSSVLRVSTHPYCGRSALSPAPIKARSPAAAPSRPLPRRTAPHPALAPPPCGRPAALQALGAKVSKPPAATRERRRGPADAPARGRGGLAATTGTVRACRPHRRSSARRPGRPSAAPGRVAVVPGGRQRSPRRAGRPRSAPAPVDRKSVV